MMFKKFLGRSVAGRNTREQSTTPAVMPACFPRNDEGFFIPQSAGVLLSTPFRQQCLKLLSQNVALPEASYRTLCLVPLQTLAERLQCVPAGREGKYKGEGGLLDLSLQMAVYSVRLSLKEMFPKGVPSEEQTKQHSAWNFCVFCAGLFYWLPLVGQFEGQTGSLTPWQPGLTAPAEPFRFRFREAARDFQRDRQTLGALTGFRLLPEPAVQWLAQYPAALSALTECLAGVPGGRNDLRGLLQEAVDALPAEVLPATTETSLPLQENHSPVVPPDAQSHDATLSAEIMTTVGHQAVAAEVPSALAVNLADPAIPRSVPQVREEGEKMSAEGDPLVPPSDDLRFALSLTGAEMMTEDENRMAPGETDEKESFPARKKVEPEAAAVTEIQDMRPDGHTQKDIPDTGQMFWAWLKTGLQSGEIAVNTAEARVHSVMGYLYCQSPGIFYLFKQTHPSVTQEINELIPQFEALKLHRTVSRNNVRVGHFRGRLYSSPPDALLSETLLFVFIPY